jgi:hypothetical protein
MIDTHERFDRDEMKAASERSFGLMLTAVFALVAFWPMAFGAGLRLWSLALAIAFLGATLAHPRILYPLNRLWFRVGHLMHQIVTPIVMGLIFLFGILPTALIMRMRRRDPLRIRVRQPGETNWITRAPPGPNADSMKHLF